MKNAKTATVLPVRELAWSQPRALKMAYELHQANSTIATLEFRSATGSLAVGTCREGAWTFKRVGFFKPRITIRVKDQAENIAVFANQTWKNGGSISLADGRTFPVTTNFWQSEFEIQTPSGQPLIRFRNDGFLRMSSVVSVFSNAANLSELPWLMMLGWYIALVSYMDTASTISITGVLTAVV